MNVNPSSERFTEVVAWDSLTEAEKASGDWIQLPDVSKARRVSEIEKVFGGARKPLSKEDEIAALSREMNERERRIRAELLGRPTGN